MKILCINCHPDLSYFTNRGLPFDVTYETITEKFPLNAIKTAQDQYGNTINFFSPWPAQYLENKYKTFQYSVILVGFNPQDYDPRGNSTGGYTHSVPLSCGTVWATVREDPYTNDYIIHELHHALVYILNVNFGLNKSNQTMIRDYMDVDQFGRPYYLNDQRDNPQSNHAQTWNQIKLQLSKLLAITYQPMYKYFKESEVVGLVPQFVRFLDQARGVAGVPFIITSGYRDPAHNTEVGGVQNSAHELGLAVDLLIKDTVSGGKILQALQQVGFKRFGFYTDNHLHVDMANDAAHPSPCYWVK